ncbi:MAG: fibronectin type III domain-containing protein, partial [Planctomycetes bacterium]|nr:fibronectin type III domain-containing protein [Planctomycetota bacterium]
GNRHALKTDEEIPGPAMMDDYGGPDSFGYHWIDSDEPNGPVFNWTDISDAGTEINLGDDAYQQVTLPFDFPFYDNLKTNVKISSNGYLTFGNSGGTWQNDNIPDTSQPNDYIAPFWDDLNPNDGGSIHYLHDTLQNKFIVQYTDLPHHSYGGPGGPYTFQVILMPNGRIVFQYLEMASLLNSATVGIENSNGSDGLGIVFNNNYVHDNLAVQISAGPDWLTVEPLTAVVPPGSFVNFNVNFDATGLDNGIYNAEIILSGNYPYEPELTVPVELSVSDNPVNPPAAPTYLSTNAVTANQVNLSWTDNSNNETGFKIERSLGTNGNFTEIATVGAGLTAYEDNTVSGGQQYCYRVRAYNSVGNSNYTNISC